MDVQKTTINAIRILSAEAIEKAKSGHPGLPMGCAPIAYTLFQNFLKFNAKDLTWQNRDRFVRNCDQGIGATAFCVFDGVLNCLLCQRKAGILSLFHIHT